MGLQPIMRALSSFGIIAPAALFLCIPALHAQRFGNPDVLAPDFPTPEAVVEQMLQAAHLKPGETLYDLGSGFVQNRVGAGEVAGSRGPCQNHPRQSVKSGSPARGRGHDLPADRLQRT